MLCVCVSRERVFHDMLFDPHPIHSFTFAMHLGWLLYAVSFFVAVFVHLQQFLFKSMLVVIFFCFYLTTFFLLPPLLLLLLLPQSATSFKNKQLERYFALAAKETKKRAFYCCLLNKIIEITEQAMRFHCCSCCWFHCIFLHFEWQHFKCYIVRMLQMTAIYIFVSYEFIHRL